MSTARLRFRQVHLDFHTSAVVTDVGLDFDAQAFADAVRQAHVDSMTVFAKCHHGFSYYPTTTGTRHPHLSFDLLGRQIEALHAVDVRAPIYVSIMWDDLAGEQHPDWIVARKDGTLAMRPPLSNQSPLTGGQGWTALDVGSPYGDYVAAQVEEICRSYDVDGFFFDICFPLPNYAPGAQARMRAAGVRLDDDGAVVRYAEETLHAFFERISGIVRDRVADATVFYNGTVTPVLAGTLPYQTHFEIESLPTSSDLWGYLHYPIMSRHARTQGVDFLGMTGRFHKAWADFGGLKTRDQLAYECGTILAAGGKISIGDQLHPRGQLDPAVYRLIGHAFERVERWEPWLADARPAAEVAIVSKVETGWRGNQPIRTHAEDVEGAAQLFLESAIQFDIIDPSIAAFDRYTALVLPDGLAVDTSLRSKLAAFLDAGGKLILSGTAALDPVSGEFGVNVPVRYVAPAPTTPSYLRPDDALAGQTELSADYDYVFYERAHVVRPDDGARSYGELRRALFDRTWEHFTSHAQAPVGERLDAPVVVANDQVLYFAAPLFAAYRNHDYWVYRALALNAIRAFLPPPLLLVSGPGWIEAALHTASATDEHPARRIAHLVAYQPRRTLQPVQHVDQAWQTAGLSIRVLVEGASPQLVYLAPDGEPLAFQQDGAYVLIDLPPLQSHAVVVLE